LKLALKPQVLAPELAEVGVVHNPVFVHSRSVGN
jgi:hypothetical protein